MKKAIVKNLKDYIYHPEFSSVYCFCTICGAEYSANKADYWNLPEKKALKYW